MTEIEGMQRATISLSTSGILPRIGAAFLDFVLLCFLVAMVFWTKAAWWSFFIAFAVFLEVGYALRGSIGKWLFGLSIEVSGRGKYYLRETVGKLASLAMFGIGFLMAFGKEGLALHDLIAKSRVVRQRRVSLALQLLGTLALVAAIGTLAFWGGKFVGSRQLSEPKSADQRDSLSDVTRQIPAVITIYCYDEHGKLITQGSGFLIDANGVGITNFHVLKAAYRAEAKLGDGRLYNLLAVHAYNEDRDIATFQLGRKTSLEIELAKDLPYLALSSEDVHIGDRIATVGSPEGLSNTVSDGLVSAIRSDSGEELLQITAPISPGSSGGPVFNLQGEVVAITSYQFREGQNLNFAIPINEVSKIKDQRANLPLEQVYLKFRLSPYPKTAAKSEASAARTDAVPEANTSFTGTYVGTVHNLTAGLTAVFRISMGENEGVVAGCMVVEKPLNGSGPVTGFVKGADVQFDVTSPTSYIQFEGRRDGKQLSGTYRVLPSAGDAQQGNFILNRKDTEGLPKGFDPQRDCNR